MTIRLVINPFEPNGSCRGCIFNGIDPVRAGWCDRPEGYDSCIVDSSYGLHFGIYVEDKTGTKN